MFLTTASSAHVPVATFFPVSRSHLFHHVSVVIDPPTTFTVHLCTRTDLHHDESTILHWLKDRPEKRTSTHLNTHTHTHISTVSPKSVASHPLPAVSFRSSSILSLLHNGLSFFVHRMSKSSPFAFQLLPHPSLFRVSFLLGSWSCSCSWSSWALFSCCVL